MGEAWRTIEGVMATALKPSAYPHIVETPGVRGGRPRIEGTRITVMDIVSLERLGISPEQMRTHFASRPLTLAEVYSALGFYHDHKAEIDACFDSDGKWAEGHEERRAEHSRRRSGE